MGTKKRREESWDYWGSSDDSADLGYYASDIVSDTASKRSTAYKTKMKEALPKSSTAKANVTVEEPRPLLELSQDDKRYYLDDKKFSGTRYRGLDWIPLDPRLDPPPQRCFSCWQRGHVSRNCDYPLISLFCRNCGRRGIDMLDCPRCKRVYTEHLIKDSWRSTELASEKPKKKSPSTKSEKSKPDPEPADLNLSLLACKEDSDPGYWNKTDDFRSDLVDVVNAVRHLRFETQNQVVRQWVAERKNK